MCNCEYCIECERCGHKADEHIAGEGNCFRCNCTWFTNKAADAWNKLDKTAQETTSFESFVDNYPTGK